MKPHSFETMFDFDKGDLLKTEGMEQAAQNRESALRRAKAIAVQAAEFLGAITADNVYSRLSERDYKNLGNAAGSIFRGPEWEFTGEWRKSRRVSNHGRMIRVWRLKT